MVCCGDDKSSAIVSDEFTIGPPAKARVIGACGKYMGGVAADYGKKGATGLVIGVSGVKAGQGDEFGMHEGLLKYVVYGLGGVCCPFCVGFLNAENVGIKVVKSLCCPLPL